MTATDPRTTAPFNPTRPDRRKALIWIAAGLGTPLLAGPALAVSEAVARALVDRLVADINAVISSGRSEAAMYTEFERIFTRYADVPVIARYALGNDVRRASPAQLQAFTSAFQRYISVRYGRRFREFIGGQIVTQSTRTIRNGVEVRAQALLRGQSPFEVSFLVSDRSGKPLFFNMFIEGINMLLSERTEIGAMLDRRRGDIDLLIADLRAIG